MKKCILLGLSHLLVAFNCCLGQDTTLLQTVDIVVPSQQSHLAGQRSIEINKEELEMHGAKSLANVLQDEGLSFIKSYGISGLQSMSFRGGSASHTLVLWEGIPLNGISHGIVDLNLFTANSLDDVQLVTGAMGAKYGTSAVGGTLILNQSSPKHSGIDLNLGIGSFGHSNFSAGFQAQATPHLTLQAKFGILDARNDLMFTNTSLLNRPTEVLKNARVNQRFSSMKLNFNGPKNSSLAYSFFWNQSQRELPGNMATMPNFAEQFDQSFKHQIQWSIKTPWNPFFQVWQSFDRLEYVDPEFNTNSLSITRSWGFRQEYARRVWGFNVSWGQEYMNPTAEGSNYDLAQDHVWTLKSSIQKKINKHWNTHLDFRKEFRQFATVPFIPSLGLEWKKSKWKWYASTGKHFRVPTFNDMFWNPGGNPNLKPESGINFNTGWAWQTNGILVEITPYFAALNQWIQWAPQASGFWSPENILEVHSRGLDFKAKWKINRVSLQGFYQFNQALIHQGPNTGKQLIYSPVHQGHLRFGVKFSPVQVFWTANYTGYRFTSYDNLEWLPGYWNHQIAIQANLDSQLSFSFRLDNVFNSPWVGVVGQVPQPRTYQINVSIKLKNKKNEN